MASNEFVFWCLQSELSQIAIEADLTLWKHGFPNSVKKDIPQMYMMEDKIKENLKKNMKISPAIEKIEIQH